MKAFVHTCLGILNSASPGRIDRPEIVAHATLTGLMQHWPEHPYLEELGIPQALSRTQWIRDLEAGRWIKQRRIGLAKLARFIAQE